MPCWCWGCKLKLLLLLLLLLQLLCGVCAGKLVAVCLESALGLLECVLPLLAAPRHACHMSASCSDRRVAQPTTQEPLQHRC